jgi:poly(3-hydroxybutyrate) depolymerase
MIKKISTLCSVGLALALTVAIVHTPSAFGQAPDAAKGGAPKGGFAKGPDPRVQQRTYHFDDNKPDMAYALFVSSKVSKDKKAPLIVALHGLGGDGNSLLRGNAIDLAEAGGYILVGPMGYNTQGWFGSPVIVMGGAGAGKGKGAPGAGPGGAKGPGGPGGAPGGAPGAAAKGGPPGAGAAKGGGTPDPPNLAELSEKDVMNVLALVRKEFNVDPQRTYLMGHSMGGAGALFLGVKHVNEWAAVAAMAPAAFLMQPESLGAVKDTMPLYLAHGDADTVVPTDVGRRWAATAKSLPMKDFTYFEIPGADHGTVITQAMPEIFKFFAARKK